MQKAVGLVQQARMNKIMAGLATLAGAMTVKLNNLAAMEINQVRPFFLGMLDLFHKYQRVSEHCNTRPDGDPHDDFQFHALHAQPMPFLAPSHRCMRCGVLHCLRKRGVHRPPCSSGSAKSGG